MSVVQLPISTYPSIESLSIDSPLRKLYPDDIYPNGNYYRSPLGRVRYWIVGPPEGKKVVFIHGISTPSIIFQHIVNEVSKSGFQVLIYDLYGRGYSEAPTEKLSNHDYTTQLALLLQYVGWTTTYVVGLSMGGGIAASFTATFPHLVNGKLVLLASAGLLTAPPTSNKTERTLPHLTSQGIRAEQTSTVGQLRNLQMQSLPGYGQVIQDSLKEGPISGLEWAFEALATIQTAGGPVNALIIHGTNDTVVPYTEAGKIKALVPQARLVTVEGASHFLVGEEGHWQIVASNIVGFLSD